MSLLWPVVDIIEWCPGNGGEFHCDQWEISIKVDWFVADGSQ
jgi:hypothetical protein